MLNALDDVQSGQLREGVPDILWTTQFAVDSAPYKNVYAELGTTFASCAITFPTVCANILGQLMKFMGEDRILFGSDWFLPIPAGPCGNQAIFTTMSCKRSAARAKRSPPLDR